MPPPLLECRDVSFRYGDRVVLDSISFTAEKAARIGIMGPNGVGKTTLLRLLSGALQPPAGEIRLDGRRFDEYSRRELAQRVAVVSQEETGEFSFSVEEAVALGRFPYHQGLYFENENDLAVTDRILELCELADLRNRNVTKLSGGERQRVRLARALAQEPDLLLLDEPTNHLDLWSQLSLIDILDRIHGAGATVLTVSHDINFLARCSSRLFALQEGTLIYGGPPNEVVTKSSLAECFGVEVSVDVNPDYGSVRVDPLRRLIKSKASGHDESDDTWNKGRLI